MLGFEIDFFFASGFKMIQPTYQSLIEKLDEFIRKYYKNQLLRGLIYSSGLLLLSFISLTVTEYYAHFNTAVRSVLFYSFITVSTFIIVKYIAIPLSKLYKLGKLMSHQEAANIIGKHFSNVQDKLMNVLQLQQQSQSGANIHIHDSLLEASIDQKIKDLKPVPFSSAIDFSENKKYLKYALIPVLLIVIISFRAPGILKDGAKRLVKHNDYFEKESPFQFVILNNNLKTVAQQDFELKVKLTGNEIPDNIYVEIDGNAFKMDKEGSIVNFNYTFKNVQKNTAFQFSADGFKSKEYELIALPNPILLDFEVSLVYPKYLNKKSEVIKNTGNLVVPAGTKADWNFHTQNTDQLRIHFNDTSFIVSPLSENTYSYSTKLFWDKTYAVTTSNSYLKNKDSISYNINVIPDAFPEINVEEKKDSNSTKHISFSGEVKDDYGFNKLTFNYRYISYNDSAASDSYKKLTTNSKVVAINNTTTQDQFFHYWDMNELGISPGDQIEYYFEVWDNDGVTGSKSTRSQKMIFKAPTLNELDKNTEVNNNKIKDDLEKSIIEAKSVQKELSDLQRKVAEKKVLTWEEKKKLQDLLDKQKELQKRVEKIKNDNQQNNQQQSEYKQPDEKILEKQKQLEELFDKVMTPELKEKYEELRKMMDKLDKDKVQEAIDKMKLDNKDLMKELDRNLEIFKQLEFEQKLQKSIEKLDDLAKKQEELSKKSEEKNADAKQQKEKQDVLNKEFEDVKKDLKDLEKKNSELEDPKKLDNTDKQQEDIQKEMQKSSEQLDKKDKKDAAKSQKSASEKMQKMSEQLAQMQQEMDKEEQSEDINKLRDILENLIQLSFGQEALMGELSTAKTNDPQFFKINRKQNKLQEDAKMIEDSLFALSKRVPQIQSVVNREISAINMNMEKAVDEIKEAPTPSFDGRNHKQEAMSRQQFAMTSINNLALMLNEALSQMQAEAKKQGKPGSGNCNKPGGKGSKPSAASVRKLQEQLNQQIKKLKEGMEKNGNKPGNKPGEKPGEKGGMGGSGMSQELAKLAAQQEAIRKELQNMADQLNKDGKSGSGIGKLADKMEETETDLVNKMISQETINRQEEILTRLLESEKAEKEREMEEKRQSNEAKSENYSNLSEFKQYKLLKQKETELLKTVSPALNPFFKAKVNQYFNNFKD